VRVFVVLLLVVHASVHLLGVARAFDLAEIPGLERPIDTPVGVLWGLAALIFLAAAAAAYQWPQGWWAVALAGVAVSMLVVVPSGNEAWAGAIVNLVVVVAAGFGLFVDGPAGLRGEYRRDVEDALARTRGLETPAVTDGDLAPLPGPVRRYLRAAGVVGQPRVTHVFVRMHGRIRQGTDEPWMPLVAEQYDVFDQPSRFFYLTARRMGLPVQGYHRYAGTEASMRIRVAAVLPVADASGPEMARAEMVTFFNDMCLFAPATLLDPAIEWELLDDRTVAATYGAGRNRVRAVLSFDASGALVDFRSEDRAQASPDGRTLTPMPWSTPIAGYRSFGPFRLTAGGPARWHAPGGAWDYIELVVDEVVYNR